MKLEIDLYELLTSNRLIADIWTTSDVRRLRDDLTEDQCWQVLQLVHANHDQSAGFYDELIETCAEELFGIAPSLPREA